MLLSPRFHSQSAEWLTIGSGLWTKRWQSRVGPGLWRAPTQSWRWRAGSWRSRGTWNGGWFGCQHPAQSPRLAPDSSCRDKRVTWEAAAMETGRRFWEDNLVLAIKNVNGCTLWPSHSISRYPTEMVAYNRKDMCTETVTALFFTVMKRRINVTIKNWSVHFGTLIYGTPQSHENEWSRFTCAGKK